jgi:dTMP kinase
MSLLITFEGGEGAGKSTQAKRLAAAVYASGREVVLTREPAIRALLLNPATKLTPLADTLLHFSARADHVETVIRPALNRGAVVICDRFYDSTMAYQHYGMGVDAAAVTALSTMIGLVPNLTLILQVQETVGKKRLKARGDLADRYELMGAGFMARIAAGFAAIAAEAPARCALIDAGLDQETVFAAILAVTRARLNLP